MHILIGDINLNLLKQNNLTKKYLNLLHSFSFDQTLFFPTRLTSFSETLIDHIFIHKSPLCNYNYTTNILNNIITDHCPIQVNIENLEANEQTTSLHKFRPIKRKGINNFIKLTEKLFSTFNTYNENLSPLFTPPDLNSKFDNLLNTILTNFNICFPFQTNCTLQKNHKPWITLELKKQIKQNSHLFKIFSKQPTLFNEFSYKNFRSKLRNNINYSKSNYFKNQLNTNKKSSREKWNTINKLLKSNIKQTNIEKITCHDSLTTNDPYKISNILNEHFTKNNTQSSSHNFKFYGQHNKFSLFFELTDSAEIFKTINALKNTLSYVDNDIPILLWKYISHIISPIFSTLFNESFLSGIFPNCLKCSKIIPIFKKGDRNLPQNYRPISITHNISKMMESIMLTRLNNFFTKYNLLDQNQFGFRKKCSTKDAITTFFSKIYNALDKNNLLIAILLDLSKAFDKVNHEFLLNKLSFYGIRGFTLLWIKNFLTNRICKTYINNTFSQKNHITSGVPQGAILSPFLYSIFINDFSEYINMPCTIYADDTILYLSNTDINNLKLLLPAVFDKLLYYYNSNELVLNTEKTQLILFGDKHIYDWKVNSNISLKNLKSVKYLGLTINNTLTLNSHSDSIIHNVNKYLYILKSLRHYFPDSIKHLLLISLILPHFKYACPYLSTCNTQTLSLINKSYSRLIKIFYNFPLRTNTILLYKLTNLPTIYELIDNSLYSFGVSIYNKSLPISTLTSIMTNIFSKRMYSSRNAVMPLYHTKFPNKNFIFKSILKFNEKK
jgi:hypothetical protein